MVISVEKIDEQLEGWKQYITEEKTEREEYLISEFDFSHCHTEEEVMEQAGQYAKDLNQKLEQARQTTKIKLQMLQKYYTKKLFRFQQCTIKEALEMQEQEREQLGADVKLVFQYKDEYGKAVKQLFLDEKRTIATQQSPENFEPVILLKQNKNGTPYFVFSGEWVPQVRNDFAQMMSNIQVSEEQKEKAQARMQRDIKSIREQTNIKKETR